MTTADGTLGTGLDAAWAAAFDAASIAGVDIRELHGTDVTLAQEVIGQVWGSQLIPQEVLLRALAHAGCTLLGAVVDEQPIGVTLGFLGWAGGIHLHSHMTAVVPGHGSAGVGYALKLWQRAVCLREGIREVRWTYDPLVARNAYFNLVKLGAVVESLHANFYGAMVDTVNAGDESDRFEVSWWLDSSRVLAALSGHPQLPTDVVRSHEIPEDYTTLARSDPAAAREVRLAARAALLAAQDERLAIEWDGGAYRFTRRALTEGLRASPAVTGD
jgi:predicted GNAT superfamily acetyltransferase